MPGYIFDSKRWFLTSNRRIPRHSVLCTRHCSGQGKHHFHSSPSQVLTLGRPQSTSRTSCLMQSTTPAATHRPARSATQLASHTYLRLCKKVSKMLAMFAELIIDPLIRFARKGRESVSHTLASLVHCIALTHIQGAEQVAVIISLLITQIHCH